MRFSVPGERGIGPVFTFCNVTHCHTSDDKAMCVCVCVSVPGERGAGPEASPGGRAAATGGSRAAAPGTGGPQAETGGEGGQDEGQELLSGGHV